MLARHERAAEKAHFTLASESARDSRWQRVWAVARTNHFRMLIKVGYRLVYRFTQRTPLILNLNVHYSRASDLVRPDNVLTNPVLPVSAYRDTFGNWCTRLVAPPGELTIFSETEVRDNGVPDVVAPWAEQVPVELLPEEALLFLLGSRYCETDVLSETAWQLFGTTPGGWARVQAICDFVHRHITFGYEHASPKKTAMDAFKERRGVCRDYAHLAVAFCRCMNIPARYCTGYLGDIGIPPPYGPMDFAGWMEVFLGGRWYTFDPRNNVPRIGRILIARGRDAADVAINTTFGPSVLEHFSVQTDEVTGA